MYATRLPLLIALAALAASACDTASPTADVDDGLTVQTDRAVYALGDAVSLSLTNEQPGAVELAAPLILGCSVELERLRGDVWDPVPLFPTPMCVAQPVRVPGKQTVSEAFRLHAETTGQYRYTVWIAGEQRAFSPPFGVR